MSVNTTGNIHSKLSAGTVDGPGIRYVIFCQGCPLRCRFCHNPDTWNVTGGTKTTVSELVADIKKYENFLKISKGGVTLTGGEPLLQKDFVLSLFKELKKLKFHTALDTSGYIVIDEMLDNVLDLTDLVLLDIKHLDKEAHKDLTGVTNTRIKEFLDHLQEKNIKTWIRFVVVVGINDDLDYVDRYAKFVKQYSCVEQVEILPYHEMGVRKWKELGLDYTLSKENIPTKQHIQKIREIFKNNGVKTA